MDGHYDRTLCDLCVDGELLCSFISLYEVIFGKGLGLGHGEGTGVGGITFVVTEVLLTLEKRQMSQR